MVAENSQSDLTPKPLPPSDEEVEKMLSRFNELHRNLEKKLDEMYGTQGLTYKDVNDYLENQGNFTDEEWDRLEKKREEVREEILEKLAIGATSKKKKQVEKKKAPRKFRAPRKGWMKMD